MKLIMILAIFFNAFCAKLHAETLSIGFMAGDRPPYYMIRDGKPKGIFVDIIKLISKETKLKFDIRILPNQEYLMISLEEI